MAILDVRTISASHGQLDAVHDVSLELHSGKILFLLGANGAGKTTLLRTIAGDHPIKSGQVILSNTEITGKKAHWRARSGLSLVPEGRRLFPHMTVRENLMLGHSSKRKGDWTIEFIYETFPNIAKHDRTQAKRLSGGEQQAVAIGRALIGNPIVLMIDEISLGLSPTAVESAYAAIGNLQKSGIAILIVEQDLSRSLDFADELLVMCEGRVTHHSTPSETSVDELAAASFGLNRSI